jgi:hypothetical protein
MVVAADKWSVFSPTRQAQSAASASTGIARHAIDSNRDSVQGNHCRGPIRVVRPPTVVLRLSTPCLPCISIPPFPILRASAQVNWGSTHGNRLVAQLAVSSSPYPDTSAHLSQPRLCLAPRSRVPSRPSIALLWLLVHVARPRSHPHPETLVHLYQLRLSPRFDLLQAKDADVCIHIVPAVGPSETQGRRPRPCARLSRHPPISG